MRVVVDTNVFVSTALKVGSLPATALRLIVLYHVRLKSVATEQHFSPFWRALSPAADDDRLLESARSEYADVILIGDRNRLALQGPRGADSLAAEHLPGCCSGNASKVFRRVARSDGLRGVGTNTAM
jgi:predicted nucleic acid-binding protein